jgi:hypothetical protein
MAHSPGRQPNQLSDSPVRHPEVRTDLALGPTAPLITLIFATA